MDLRVGINQRDWITQIQLAVSARRSRNSFMSELKRKTSQVTHKYRKHGCKRLSFHKDPEYGDGKKKTFSSSLEEKKQQRKQNKQTNKSKHEKQKEKSKQTNKHTKGTKTKTKTKKQNKQKTNR